MTNTKIPKPNSLSIIYPELTKEWHPTKNGELSPRSVTVGSKKKVWWMCKKGHEWEAAVYKRKNGARCPFCTGHRITQENCLSTLNPELAKQWHPLKNGDLTPFLIKPGSNKKVWWKCKEGHEWEAVISARNRGNGCPYCSGRKVTKNNSLEELNPEVAKQWHPIKNGDLQVGNVTASSGMKAWWICHEGHEWEAVIASRNNGNGCPFCSGQRIMKHTSLRYLNPQLSNEWHPTKNGDLTPDVVSAKSGKKVWWICKEGHEWRTKIGHRNSGSGCPYCSGKMVTPENCLAVIKPELVEEWHPTKNCELTPYDIIAGSSKKVWWMCEKGHEWKTAISNRKNGSRCPYCFGVGPSKKINIDNSLETTHPDLVKEWHPTKNGNLSPRDISAGSGKKVWWLCQKNHEWLASIEKRAKNRSCPICNSWRHTSFSEQFLYYYIKKIFKKAKNRFKVINSNDKVEVDVYIPELKIGIEYDGAYFHDSKESIRRDESKAKFLNENNIQLIRIRDQKLPEINNFGCVILKHDNTEAYSSESLKNCLFKILDVIIKSYKVNQSIIKKIEEIKEYPYFDDDKEKIYGMMYKGERENSIAETHPYLLEEWNVDKNSHELYEFLSSGSNLKVWWKCKNGHEWQAKINARTQGKGCPVCKGKLVTNENCLATVNPKLASEWHPIKNGDLTPYVIRPGSNKKVWWKCKKGHEWEAIVQSRNSGKKCPYCSGRKATKKASLLIVNPELASEWNFTKNGILTPELILPNSNKKVWWKCKKGHEWEAVIASRSGGHGCPYCSGQKVLIEKSLAFLNPKLTNEWHFVKNGNLRPEIVSLNSGKKVWWKCKKGHEWEAVIGSRSNGNGCPYCSGRKVCKDNCLAYLNPELAEEWHPIKNKDIKPNDVIPGSTKKVWWKCKKGHEWEARIYSRNSGKGCPICYLESKKK